MVTLALWTVTDGPAIAFEAKIITTYVGELLPGLPAAAETFGSLAVAVIIALFAVRIGALVTGAFLAIEMVAILALIAAGLWHPMGHITALAAHPLALDNHGTFSPVTIGALAAAGVSAVYGTVGGNQAIYFGEELRDPHRRMGRVILMATLIGALATALPVIAVVLGAHDLTGLLRTPAPFATFLSEKLGPWAGRALSAGVALAVFNAMIAQIMISARLLFSLGRDQLFPQFFNKLFADVHERSGVPRAATLVMGGFAAICCLLSAHTLLVFLTGLIVYAWGLICLSVLVGRRKGLTGQKGYWRAPLHPLAPTLGLLLAIIFAVADLADPDAGRPSIILLGILVLLSAAWSEFVLKRRGWKPSLADVKP
jgi:amino acid transporter